MLFSIKSCWANILDCSEACIPGERRIPCRLGVPFLPGDCVGGVVGLGGVVGVGLGMAGGVRGGGGVVGGAGAVMGWVDQGLGMMLWWLEMRRVVVGW